MIIDKCCHMGDIYCSRYLLNTCISSTNYIVQLLTRAGRHFAHPVQSFIWLDTFDGCIPITHCIARVTFIVDHRSNRKIVKSHSGMCRFKQDQNRLWFLKGMQYNYFIQYVSFSYYRNDICNIFMISKLLWLDLQGTDKLSKCLFSTICTWGSLSSAVILHFEKGTQTLNMSAHAGSFKTPFPTYTGHRCQS